VGHRQSLPQLILTSVLIAPALAVMAYLSSGFPFPGHMEKVFILLLFNFQGTESRKLLSYPERKKSAKCGKEFLKKCF
jgi:hypothetical protein